jgi:RDD family
VAAADGRAYMLHMHRSEDVLYARLAPRLGAMTVDAMVLVAFIFLMVVLSSAVPAIVQGRGFGLTFILVVLFYEPVAVSFWGGTVGHRAKNLRVARAEDFRNVSFPVALIRWGFKGILGVWSLASIALSRKRQTLHDIATRSVVIARDPSRRRPDHFVMEGEPLTPTPPRARSPVSVVRRLVVVAVHSIVFTILVFLPATVWTSDLCAFEDICSADEDLAWNVTTLVWIGAVLLVAVAGWRGRLPGARPR